MAETSEERQISNATVTIGIPVFNGAETLFRTVESALSQTYAKCRIHISDNASTDATPEIAQALARQRENIIYTRHDVSLGLMGNFHYPLASADTEYFMWLPADDYIAPDYIERMLQELEADHTLVSCVSHVRFVGEDGASHIARGTYPLLGDPLTNLADFLCNPDDNCRSYGLYRTAPLLAAFPRWYFHAYDWAISAATLTYGKHAEVAEILMIRDRTPAEKYLRAIARDNQSLLNRLFPLLPMTWYLIFTQKIPIDRRVACALFHTNIAKHVEYMSLLHPAYYRITRRFWVFWNRYIDWRLLRVARSKRPVIP